MRLVINISTCGFELIYIGPFSPVCVSDFDGGYKVSGETSRQADGQNGSSASLRCGVKGRLNTSVFVIHTENEATGDEK